MIIYCNLEDCTHVSPDTGLAGVVTTPSGNSYCFEYIYAICQEPAFPYSYVKPEDFEFLVKLYRDYKNKAD